MTDIEQVDYLMRKNGELCAEINRQERRIRELEAELARYRNGRRKMTKWCGACGKLTFYDSDGFQPKSCQWCGERF